MFRDKIQETYDDLTPSFRKLADFILQNQLDVAFMTATELANRLGVDAATVVRFAQELGYTGFRELSKEIQDIVRSDLKASYAADLDVEEDLELFRSLLDNERHNLELAQDRLSTKANALLPTLLGADRIWVVGQGLCFHLAGLCASAFREIGLPAVRIAAGPLEVATNLKEIGSKDLLVGFSLGGRDVETARAVAFAGERGADTIVFASSSVASAALRADTTIVCPDPTQMEIASFTGLASMIVVTVAAFAARYPEKSETMRDAVRQSYDELLRREVDSA